MGGDNIGLKIDERKRKHKRFFFLSCMSMMKNCEVSPQRPGETSRDYGGRCMYDSKKFDFGILGGANMESTVEHLNLLKEEMVESRKSLETTFNEIQALNSKLLPMIKDEIIALRNARMSIVQETQASLVALRDVRKFFLESDYDKEVKRLTEFTTLCNELRKIKDNGTLDALCDSMLKLTTK